MNLTLPTGRTTTGASPSPERTGAARALADLARLVLRSKAPGLRWRLAAALLLTLVGKALGVTAPLLLGAAVNRLSAGESATVAVGFSFAGFALGWP